MFNGTKETEKISKNGVSTTSSVNIIGAGTNIQGEIVSGGDLRIDGKLEGTVKTDAKLVIGGTGYVKGDITCKNADISGQIEGKIKVKGLLFLKSTAQIDGSITTGKLVIEEGATFNGDCSMTTKKAEQTAEKSEPVLKKETA